MRVERPIWKYVEMFLFESALFSSRHSKPSKNWFFVVFFLRFAQVNFRNFLHNKHFIHDCFFLHLYNDLDIFVATAARMYISFFCSHIPKVNTHVPCSAVCIHFCDLFCCCLKVYNLKTIVYVMLWLFEIYDIYRIKLHVRLVFGCLEKKNSFT